MKKKEITPKQLLAIPCPTCGAPVGSPCQLHSGQKRNGAHVERKFSVLEIIEKRSDNGRVTRKR